MLRDKVIDIFVNVDDFCKEISPMVKEKMIEDRRLGKRNRKNGLCESEMVSLLTLFHYGQFDNLKSFYVYYAMPHLKNLFPGMVSYNRFVELQPRCAVMFMLFVKMRCLGKSREPNFVDSTHIKIRDNRRIHSHRALEGQAERGQCSIGKRAITECLNDELKNRCKLQHTGHRSAHNFLLNILGALAAYSFFPKSLL